MNFIIRLASVDDIDHIANIPDFTKFNQQNDFKNLMLQELTDSLDNLCNKKYFVACEPKLQIPIAFAGARYYNQIKNENMYNTTDLLPSGWYLRGIHVNNKYRRLGVAQYLTSERLNWLKNKSDHCFVFLDDENKISLSLYLKLGFVEISRGWTFLNNAKSTLGILLKFNF